MGTIFAQVGPLSPPSGAFVGDFLKCLVLLLIFAGLALGVRHLVRRPKPRAPRNGEQPPRPRYVRGDICDGRMLPLEERLTRLDGPDGEISKIWFTLRDEDAKTRTLVAEAVRDFDQTIGETKGTLDQLQKTTAALLKKLLEG